MREGHRPTHTCGPRWFGKSGTRWRSRMQVLGSGCPMLERPPTAAVSASERREETRKAGETPSPGRVVIGQPAKETFNFKYFQQHFIHAQRINSGLASTPPQLCAPRAEQGWGRCRRWGGTSPAMAPHMGHLTLLLSVPLFLPVKRGGHSPSSCRQGSSQRAFVKRSQLLR